MNRKRIFIFALLFCVLFLASTTAFSAGNLTVKSHLGRVQYKESAQSYYKSVNNGLVLKPGYTIRVGQHGYVKLQF
ncbi:MAG: hypothetical protein KAS64_07380, partial [Spirochaetes bacterium]|nr:hypothetical protein [Spirochaetota bacterium]